MVASVRFLTTAVNMLITLEFKTKLPLCMAWWWHRREGPAEVAALILYAMPLCWDLAPEQQIARYDLYSVKTWNSIRTGRKSTAVYETGAPRRVGSSIDMPTSTCCRADVSSCDSAEHLRSTEAAV